MLLMMPNKRFLLVTAQIKNAKSGENFILYKKISFWGGFTIFAILYPCLFIRNMWLTQVCSYLI